MALVATYSTESYKHTLTLIADTLPRSAAEGQIFKATSPSFEWGILPQLVRHPSKESKAEETHKNGKSGPGQKAHHRNNI